MVTFEIEIQIDKRNYITLILHPSVDQNKNS
jgi:hypothetical protein